MPGTLRPATLEALRALLALAAERHLLVDLTFTRETLAPMLSVAAYQTALMETARQVADARHVLFDVQNEYGRHGLTSGDVVGLVAAVRAVDPARVVTASLSLWDEAPGVVGRLAADTGLSVIAAHREAAIGPWYAEATVVGGVAALKAGAAPAVLPVYLQEPTAWGTRAWDDLTPGRHRASAVAAKRAGAAAWTFHQRVGFDLTTESFRARLERAGALRAEVEAVVPAVAGEGWGVATVADEVTYYHLDALGSVRAVSDQAGQVVARHDYRAFGEEVTTGPGVDARRFTGKERDAESGLDYFGARYYRADIGRFTTIDPVYTWQENLVDPQRWNRYAYVRNNPLRWVDPDGRWFETVWDVANVVMGVKSAYDNVKSGDYLSAAADIGGVAVDVAAAVIPGVPGGAGTAIKVARIAERADDAVDVVKAVQRGETAAAKGGRIAHDAFNEKVKVKPGWRSQPQDLVDPATGRKVVPDAVTPSGRPIEYKPNTPSGRRAGKSQMEKYERATGRKGRVVYYEPK